MNIASIARAVMLAILPFGASTIAPAMELQLQGKIALVTGSTAGIGYATAKGLLKEGVQVIINSRTQDSLDKASAALREATGHAPMTFRGDMSKSEDIARLTKAYPRVDILVNNVGRMIFKEFLQASDQDWFDTFELNVMSGVRLARFYLPAMKERNWGRIIFISSESALQIPLESVHYGMSKAAQIAVARGIAEGVAGTGITVNSILPGPTRDPEDPRTADLVKRFGAKSIPEMEATFFKTVRPTSLIRRFANPDEVAALIVYIASPLASATTGSALRVDGGVVKSAF